MQYDKPSMIYYLPGMEKKSSMHLAVAFFRDFHLPSVSAFLQEGDQRHHLLEKAFWLPTPGKKALGYDI